MNGEFGILGQLLPKLAFVMHVVPEEVVHIKESDMLLIIQRRMKESDLQKELMKFNQIFGNQKALSIHGLAMSAKAYIKIKVLVEKKAFDFDVISHRELIREYKVQITKMQNLIHLTQINEVTVEQYQLEKNALILKKNEAFLEAFLEEVERLETMLEEIPKSKEEEVNIPIQEEVSVVRESSGTDNKAIIPNVVRSITQSILKAKEKDAINMRMKMEEQKQSVTKCVEIPFYDKSLTFTEKIPCKDILSYTLLKRKNSIYFGVTKNIRKAVYDNRDQSLLELTEATDEFLQFMSEDLLDAIFQLETFTDKEKVGLRMYYNFLLACFQKQIGITLTIEEYVDFKLYYNRLITKIFELKKKQKEVYYEALMLADRYIDYAESYDLKCEETQEEVVANIIQDENERYIEEGNFILKNHMVDEYAKNELLSLIRKIEDFNKADIAIEEEQEQVEMPQQLDVLSVPSVPFTEQPDTMQIVVQILNQKREVVDEALYIGSNIQQALHDYAGKHNCIKRLGFRSNGGDTFYSEEINI